MDGSFKEGSHSVINVFCWEVLTETDEFHSGYLISH